MPDLQKRIIDLTEITDITDDMYMMLDQSAVGTRKYNLKRMYDRVDESSTAASAAADAATSATLQAIEARDAASEAASTAVALIEDSASRVDAAIDAIGDISELAVPLMSESTRGGAKLGHGLTVEDGALGIGSVTDATDAGPIVELTAKGWAEQDTTVGKNLYPNTIPSGITKNNCTATFDGNELVMVASGADMFIGQGGFATGRPYDLSHGHKFACSSGQSYTLSLSNTALTANYIIFFDSNDTITTSPQGNNYTKISSNIGTFTIPSNATYFTVRIGKSDAVSGTAYRTTVQLELGSTATPYEPYSGAAPSPSPSFPQEVRRCRGRNLIDPHDTNVQWLTIAADGKISSNGTAAALAYENCVYFIHLNAGTYTLSFVIAKPITDGNSYGGWALYKSDGTSIEGQTRTERSKFDTYQPYSPTFTLSSDDTIGLFIRPNGAELYVQLELGSVAHHYVPYGCVGVDVQGRNLAKLNISNAVTKNGITLTHNDDGIAVFNGTPTLENIMPSSTEYSLGVLEAGSYTATIQMLSGTCSSTYRVRIGRGSNSTYVNGSPYVSEGVSSYTFTANGTDEYYAAVQVSASGAVCNNATFAVQVTKGDSVLPYEPYANYSIPIPLPSRGWVAALPDGTADTLTLDGAGGYVWEMNTAEKVYDGSSDENWLVGGNYASTGGGHWRIDNPEMRIMSVTHDNSMCDRLCNIINTGVASNTTGAIGYGNAPSQVRVRPFEISEQMTVEQIRTWLASNPLTFLLPLATPTTESGYVSDFPTVPAHSTLNCPDLTDLAVRCCADEGAAEISAAWGKRYESRIAALEEIVANLI